MGMREQAGAVLALLLVVAGCGPVERWSDRKLTIETPIEWWYDLQGGKIAEVRPPPPGVADPYPNLSEVPPAPTPTDPVTRRALAARLAAERDRTQREATQDPLVLPMPAAPAVPRTPPPDPGASTAVMDAATAPPAAPPRATPPSPVEPVPPPATSAAIPIPAPVARAESGPLPDLPTAPPPLPRLSGMPATVDAPPVPRLPPAVTIAFRPGSDALPASADAALRELAGRRAGASIAVAAGGDGAGMGADAQARALPLALRRGRAIQAVLVAAGVPPGALRVDAAALGRGGAARLIQ